MINLFNKHFGINLYLLTNEMKMVFQFQISEYAGVDEMSTLLTSQLFSANDAAVDGGSIRCHAKLQSREIL
uniref:Uncharacterized protein n=1 Tax=Nelumbo nucifera TaxID=4432 RepID=A0A822XPP1_NELNU|nr:TPA_asm: hypothetical protein HUJ06_023863 [Nelumbo nucifera]